MRRRVEDGGEGKPGSFEEQAEPRLRALLASIEIVKAEEVETPAA